MATFIQTGHSKNAPRPNASGGYRPEAGVHETQGMGLLCLTYQSVSKEFESASVEYFGNHVPMTATGINL